MSGHRLLSPTSTYLVVPFIGDLNKGKPRQQLRLHNFHSPRNLQEITVSHNGQKLPLNNHHKTRTNRMNQNPRGLIVGKKTPTFSVLNSPNRKVYNGNRSENMRKTPMDQPRMRLDGAAVTQLPGTSAQVANGNVGRSGGTLKPTRFGGPVDNGLVEESDSDSDSSFDFSDFPQKRTIDCVRLPYTAREDIEIMEHVFKGNNINRTGSVSLWKELEAEKTPPERTYQSLKNRFLRNIKPHLLTKYRSFLTSETISEIKRKFPELNKRKRAKLGGAMANAERRQEPDRPGAGERVQREVQRRVNDFEERRPPVMKSAVVEKVAESHQEKELSPIRETRSEEVKSGGNMEVVVPKDVSKEVPSEDTSTAVEVFVPRENQDLLVQSFRYTKMIKSLRDKTNLNLNIVLLNDSTSGMVSNWTGPVKVDIVVSLSSVQANEVATTSMQWKEIPCQSGAATNIERKEQKKRKPERKRIKPRKMRKVRTGRKYVLRLRKCNYRKLLNLTPTYKQSLAELLQKIESNLEERRKTRTEGGEDGRNPHGMVLRSRTRNAVPDVVLSGQTCSDGTQETNCSIEDDSDYSQVYREVKKTYQIVTEPDGGCDSAEEDSEKPCKRPRTRANPLRSNMLLKNMVGMLSPSSKVFTDREDPKASISKQL